MQKNQKKRLFNDIKKKISKGLQPDSIYIFGSFARNEETENSDIDILIEKPTSLVIQKRFGLARKYLKGIPYPCDILMYTPEEIKERLNDKYSVVYQAINNGIKIL